MSKESMFKAQGKLLKAKEEYLENIRDELILYNGIQEFMHTTLHQGLENGAI